jgi:hypothetical protein
MAKKGNNNKNKVTNPGTRGNRLSKLGKFQELNDEGKVKYTDARLDTTRRKMKSVNMASKRGQELLAQEAKHLTNITIIRGEQIKQVKDLSFEYDNIFSRQQEQTKAVEQLYGVQNKLADKLKLAEGYALEIASATRQTRDMSLEELNTNRRTTQNLQRLNRLKLDAVNHSQKLTLYNKDNIPYYDKINKIQAEIAVLTKTVGDNADTENAHRLEVLKTMEKEYETIGKLEKKNDRKEEIQKSINDLMTLQGTAAGTILNTLKDIVTNPLLIFTGLLALGVSRFETMRGYGNQLAEELDRVNKKLAGSGPYQEAIIKRARKIHSIFRAAGEGFSSSLENAVDAIQALQKQLGNINIVSGDLVDLMSTIKLSINLSDEDVAKVIDTYLIVGNHSEKAAENAANMLYSMSESVGLNPAETFKEIANATGETLAHFRGGTQELNEAVVAAKKMGLGLEDVAKISKGLLDFESSIEAEMEAQMLTGINLNFNKARHFAMNKQGAKAAQEVLRQVGGLKKFQQMNIFQQESIAKATGLSVDELLKTNVQRERENRIKKEQQEIHKDTVKMLPIVTRVMGKIETGLGIIEKLANILGDIVLDVFGVNFKQAEELILKFVKSDTFQTGLKNILFFMKGIIEGIVDAISTVWDFIKSIPWLGDFVKKMGKQDMSGGYSGAQKAGNATGKALTGIFVANKLGQLLGMTPFTATWIRSAGGALGGITDFLAKGVKGLLGYGGQSMGTGLAGGVTKAGWLTAGAFIAKGIWDVATLTGKSTRSETAGAWGGAIGAIGGAKLGAMAGTAIFPGVGTAVGAAVGAAVGYFGGGLVKHISWFQDDLDKARMRLAKSQGELELEAHLQNSKLNMDIVKAQSDVRRKFIDFGLTTDGATKNEMVAFADAMLASGKITKGDHKKVLKGSMGAVELLERAAAGAAGNLTREQEARKVWVENQFNTKDIEVYKNLDKNQDLYKTIESLTRDIIDNKMTESGLDDRGKINYVLNPFRTQHDRDVLVREIDRLYEGTVPLKLIKEAVEEATPGMELYFTKTGAVESGLERLRDRLLQDVEILIDSDQNYVNQRKLKLLKVASKMKYDPITNSLVIKKVEDPNAVTKASGGVLYEKGGITGLVQPEPNTGSGLGKIEDFMSDLMDKVFGDYTNYWVAKTGDRGGGPVPIGLGGVGDPNVDNSQYWGGQDLTTGDLQQTPAGQKVVQDWIRNHGMPPTKGNSGWPGYHDFNGGSLMWSTSHLLSSEYVDHTYGIPDAVKAQLTKRYGSEKKWKKKIRDKNLKWDKKDTEWKESGWFGEPMIGEKPSSAHKNKEVNDVSAAMNPVVEGVYNGQRAAAPWAAAIVAAAALPALFAAGGTGLGSMLLRGGVNLIRNGVMANWGLIQGGLQRIFITKGVWSSIIGAMEVYGGSRGLSAMVNSMYDVATGEADMKDLINIFLGGTDVKKYKNVATSLYYLGKGEPDMALLPWIPDKILKGTPLGRVIYHTGGYSDAGKDFIKGGKDLYKYYASGDFGMGKMREELYDSIKSWYNSDSKTFGSGSSIIEATIFAKGGNIDTILTNAINKALGKSENYINDTEKGMLPEVEVTAEDGSDKKGMGGILGKFMNGGVTPNVTQVNDMILTADGQLIETHEDDNIIAKKGGITQKTGGASNKDIETINSLLRELIIVSNDTVVEVDGRIISENYQVA